MNLLVTVEPETFRLQTVRVRAARHTVLCCALFRTVRDDDSGAFAPVSVV